MTTFQRLTILLLLVAGITGAAGQTRRPMVLDDMFSMKRVSQTALSPDGMWVAYTLTTPDLAANRTFSDIWMTSIDGTITRRLTTNPATDNTPTWSPDGKTLAFVSSRSGQQQIWLLDLAGGEPRQFTTLSTGATQPVWSPDGTRLAFVSEVFPEFSGQPFQGSDSLNRNKIRELASGKVKARVIDRLLYRHWDHWVDGVRQHIFLQRLAAGDPVDLTPGDRDAVPTSSTFSGGIDFAFSPDGKEIAFTATPVPAREEAWSTNHDILVVPVTGGTPRQVTTNPAADGFPRYSPDGKYLLYRAQSRPGFEADQWELLLMDRAAGTTRSLTEAFDASVGTPLWSPDSRTIFFEAEERGEQPLWAVTLAGNDVRKVVVGSTNREHQISRDGRLLVFSRVSAVRPTEIHVCPSRGGAVRQVTHANDTLFAALDIPAPESITYPGAEGTPIQAWLFRPPAFDPGRKYPLVLMIHGGPQNAWLNSWSYRWCPALWAAQGYVVIAPNPHGSTGFGQKFTDAISGDWGGKVYEDLMKGLDYMERQPYVDGERKAAAGASFGGYMVNYIAGNAGERFRALVTHNGVYNLESNYGTTDEVWFDEWERGGTPWIVPEAYRKHSPHVYAGNFRAPHLVIHGAYDFRIPDTEAMQLFTALQRRGVPSRFLYFPDENHWVLKPANSKLWHETVFGWLHQHVRAGR
jgi:dipeptidyl aminopeptidase/acylaminoacyl peptidase